MNEKRKKMLMKELPETSAVVKPQFVEKQHGGIEITDFRSLKEMAEMVASSGIVPKDFADRPGACMIAMQLGMELGLPPMVSLQNVAVINGRPSIYGDVALALCRNHPCWNEQEWLETIAEDGQSATCRGARGPGKPITRSFSMDDAKRAGLSGKGPWQQYPTRMLQMRARSWVLRDLFPDALKGVLFREETVTIDVDAEDVRKAPDLLPAATRPRRGRKPKAKEPEAAEAKPDTDPPAGDAAQAQQPEPAIKLLRDALAKEGLSEDALIEFMHFKGIGEDLGTLEDVVHTGNTQWVREHWKEFKAAAAKVKEASSE